MSTFGCLNDSEFGPAVVGCRGSFDFTIAFEDIILSILPTCIFLPLAGWRIWGLSRSPSLIKFRSWLAVAKASLGTAHCILSIAVLVSGLQTGRNSALSNAAHGSTVVVTILLLILSVLEHSRSLRPSFLLNVYLLLSLLFDAAIARTQWLRLNEDSKAVLFTKLFTATVACKLLRLVAESRRKLSSSKISKEESSGIFNLASFTWLNPLFKNGYFNVLSLSDLSTLDQHIATEYLHKIFVAQLPDFQDHTTLKKHALALSLARALWRQLLLPAIPRLALVAFRFCQPLLIQSLLNHLKSSSAEQNSWKSSGYGFIGAAALVYSGVAVATALYWYCHERFQVMVRGALIAVTYDNLTQLRSVDINDSAAVTLMSSDIDRIRVGFLSLHEFWATPLEVGIACWLLYGQLGAAFVAPLVVVAASVAGSSLLGKYSSPRQKQWMQRIQLRVAETVQVLGSLKQLRISALSHSAEESTQTLRVKEMDAAARFRRFYVSNLAFAFLPMALCPLVAFAISSRYVDTATVYTSLAYLVLIGDPFVVLLGMVPNFVAAFTSFGRIQEFLSMAKRADNRHYQHISTSLSSTQSEKNKLETDAHMELEDVSAGWKSGIHVLSHFSVTVPSSSLTIVVGPVGSGKSTLCRALLAELPFTEGNIRIKASRANFRTAFCDQPPYLYSTSIRENITGTSRDFDEHRYQEAISATDLDQDLSALPLGDSTFVGSGGTTLSGGQMQRISMARAVYHLAHFYVFDDSLSGLDADTELKVFGRIFGPASVLDRRGATVVLTTHNMRLLPMANHIIILGPDANIVYEGNFADLQANQANSKLLSMIDTSSSKEPEADLASQLEAPQLQSPSPAIKTEAAVEGTSFLSDKNRMGGDSTVYRYYLGSLGRLSFIAFGLCSLGWGFFYNFGYIWLRFWTKDAATIQAKSFYIGLYSLWQACGLLSVVLCFWFSYTMMARMSGIILHRDALRSVVHAPLSFITSTDIGVVTNLFSQDMTLVDNELPMAVTNLALDICNAIGLAAVIATSSPYLAITYPILVGSLYVLQKVYLRTSRQIRLLDLEAKSPLYTKFIDTAKGLSTIRAFAWVSSSIHEAFALLDRSQKATYVLAMAQRWLLFVLQCMVAFLAILVVTLATQTQSDSSGFTGASLVALMTFGDILNFILRWWTQMETSIGAVTRLKALSDQVLPEGMGDKTVPLRSDWPSRGAIKMDNVSASYCGKPKPVHSDHAPATGLVLSDISLSIAPGEKVAICGRSGSGKSSLILLLLRILDPQSSCGEKIFIDGVDLHSIPRQEVRNRIIAMSQDAVFLPGHISVRRQLDTLHLASPDQCLQVLQLVGFDTLAKTLEDLEKPLNPESLSGGQKQLFNLARTVLRARTREQKAEKQGGILLLDEVSARVDRQTEQNMLGIIMEEFKHYTIVMVTHRLDMILDFDTLLLMDQGQLIERGSPRALVEDDESHFKKQWLAGGVRYI